MLTLLRSILSALACRFRSRAVLELENLALHLQLNVLRRQCPSRPRLSPIDRLLWIWLYRLWPRCLEAMVMVKPATVIHWHRQGFRLYLRWRSRSGRPSVDREVRKLIREMNSANNMFVVAAASAIGFPAEKGKSRKVAVFALNKRNREFESTPLRQRVLVSGGHSLGRPPTRRDFQRQ
jgi:hypothetical protein